MKKFALTLGIILTLLLQGARSVRGADWTLYAVSLDGSIEEYYDRASVNSPAAGVIDVSTKTVKYCCGERRDKKKKDRGGEAGREKLSICAHTVTRHRIECPNRIDTLLSSSDYDREGRMIQQSQESYVIPHPPFRRSPQEIYPESFSENLIKTVCSPAP